MTAEYRPSNDIGWIVLFLIAIHVIKIRFLLLLMSLFVFIL